MRMDHKGQRLLFGYLATKEDLDSFNRHRSELARHSPFKSMLDMQYHTHDVLVLVTLDLFFKFYFWEQGEQGKYDMLSQSEHVSM